MAREVGPSQIGMIAAGIAFYALLSVFPAIAAMVALAGQLIEPEAVVAQFETVTRFVPEEAARILIDEAAKVAATGDDGLSLTFALGVGFAIYLSTRATKALIHGINVANDVEEDRGILAYWATVLLLTTALVFGGALMFVLLVVTPTVLAFVPEDIVPGSTATLVGAVRWAFLLVVLLLGLAVIYRFAPAFARRWRWMSPGAFLSATCWIAGSYAFSLYVTHFADYNASFGSLGGVIILLTWFWLSAYVVLLGAMLNRFWYSARDGATGEAQSAHL